MNSLEKDSGVLLSFPEGSPIAFPIESDKPGFSGPVSGPMWDSLSKLNSSYEDTFDYSIYDKLYAKFGENQPRGGVVFKSALRLANFHDSCSKCHYSFEIDTYGRGCVHNCHYPPVSG